MGRRALPDAAFPKRFADERYLQIPQIAQTAMDQLGIVGAGGMGEVVFLDQGDGKPAQGRIARDDRRSRSRCMPMTNNCEARGTTACQMCRRVC